MDEFEPNYRVSTIAGATECPSETPWLWIVLFILALAAVIGLAVWVAYLYHNRTTSKGKTIKFTNPKIQILSDTSIKGSWDDTGDKNDVIILYASTEPLEFTSEGKPSNNDSVVKSQQATSGALTVSVDGLQSRLKYYATLVATNTSISNYQVYTQLVYMSSTTPAKATLDANNNPTNNTFSIQDILQVGKIEAAEITSGSTGPYSVVFNQAPTDPRTLWYVNNNGQLQLDETGTGIPNVCLFKNSSNVLEARDCGTASNIDTANSVWVYNPKSAFANRWCLQSTTSNATPTCMVLGSISSSTGKATVTLSDSSKPGDGWVNAFENP